MLVIGRRAFDRNETNLKTLTDHPRFATSPLRVFSNEARVSDVRVLESITQCQNK